MAQLLQLLHWNQHSAQVSVFIDMTIAALNIHKLQKTHLHPFMLTLFQTDKLTVITPETTMAISDL